jgi:hypothetical protein
VSGGGCSYRGEDFPAPPTAGGPGTVQPAPLHCNDYNVQHTSGLCCASLAHFMVNDDGAVMICFSKTGLAPGWARQPALFWLRWLG